MMEGTSEFAKLAAISAPWRAHGSFETLLVKTLKHTHTRSPAHTDTHNNAIARKQNSALTENSE